MALLYFGSAFENKTSTLSSNEIERLYAGLVSYILDCKWILKAIVFVIDNHSFSNHNIYLIL